MIAFDEAFAIVQAIARPIGAERVPLGEAVGRVLAAPVISRLDGPRSDVSTMDGYAVRAIDLSSYPCRLRVIGESFPGAPFRGSLTAGTCIRIFTGAALPATADRVVIQEIVQRSGDEAVISEPPPRPPYVRRQASDFSVGDVLVTAGRKLNARALVAAGAADVALVDVYVRPKVVIVATGDELRKSGSASEDPTSIPESISLGLEALAIECGAKVIERRVLPDNLEAMRPIISASLQSADVLIVTGGASVGERDYAKQMFDDLEILFSKVAIKPGKPVWIGKASGRLIVGLPGNPTSALVTARLLLKPLLAGLSGSDPVDALCWRSLPLAVTMDAAQDRETFWRAENKAGHVVLVPNQDSGAQSSLVFADLLVRQPAGSLPLTPGTHVDVIDF
jgi:molybdopterin molybdotransferase